MITLHNATEVKPYHFVADASELGLKPGEWPMHIETQLGNGRPLVRLGFVYPDDNVREEFSGVQYRQDLGCITVYVTND